MKVRNLIEVSEFEAGLACYRARIRFVIASYDFE